MPHIKTFAQYEEIKNIAVYVILAPVENKFFVGKAIKNALRNCFKNHYIYRNVKTKEMFQAAKEQNLVPKMYLLEELETTEAEAYKHVVAWIRYFLDQGYQSLNQDKTFEYALDLMPEVEILYNEIVKNKIDDIICEERDLFPNYGERMKKVQAAQDRKKDEDTVFIGFRATKSEAEEIKKIAKMKGVTVSEYVRETALDGAIINISFEFLAPLTRELRVQGENIKRSIYTIYKTQNYTPSDLALLQEMVDTVAEYEGIIRKELQKTMRKAFKEIHAARKR